MAQRAINIPDLSVESGEGEPLLPPVSSSIGDINGEIQVRAQLPEPRHGTSWYASVFIVVNAALGAGLLNFPAAYDAAGGIVTSVVIQAVLMVFIIGSLLVLAYCSDANQSATYQDVVYSMCGKTAQTLCSLAIIIYMFGTCITFFIIIGDQWDRFLSFLAGDDFCLSWYMNRKFTMPVTSIIIILPMCFSRRIDFLKYASAFGVLGIIFLVGMVTLKYFIGPINPGPIKTVPNSWTDTFVVVPVICFGYQCHVSVVPIYSCLAKRTVGEFLKTVIIGMVICVASYTLSGVFGYLTFGSDVANDVLVSYKQDPAVLVAIFMIAAKIYTTYPILLFCGRAAVESVWIDLLKVSPERVASEERMRRVVQASSWFVSSLVLAIFIPNIGVVIALLGGLAAIFIFVFPGLCLLQVLLRDGQKMNPAWRRLLYSLAVMFILLGAFIFGLVTTQAIWDDVTVKPKAIQGPCTDP